MTALVAYADLIARARPGTHGPGRLLDLGLGPGRIAYNPCLIGDAGRSYLAVRVESADSYWLDQGSWDPEVRLFRDVEGRWSPAMAQPLLHDAEDPFAAWLNADDPARRRLLLGAVVLDRSTDPPTVVTTVWPAAGIEEMRDAVQLPLGVPGTLVVPGMKDIRFTGLEDGRVALCGRPQGGAAGVGRVSFTIVECWDDVDSDLIRRAPLLDLGLAPDTKAGANELHQLDADTLGVLGHVATGIEGVAVHYAAATWQIDLRTGAASPPQIIATRDDFPAAEPKYPWLADVVFPGSLEDLGDGRCRLYCGVGDARVATLDLADPFL